MISVKWNPWKIVSTWYKCTIQLMYHINGWKMSKKSLTIIVQYVNKVKCYLNFHINNLKLLFLKKGELLCKCKVQLMNNNLHLLSNLNSTYVIC
jgi:hypothetical protein